MGGAPKLVPVVYYHLMLGPEMFLSSSFCGALFYIDKGWLITFLSATYHVWASLWVIIESSLINRVIAARLTVGLRPRIIHVVACQTSLYTGTISV